MSQAPTGWFGGMSSSTGKIRSSGGEREGKPAGARPPSRETRRRDRALEGEERKPELVVMHVPEADESQGDERPGAHGAEDRSAASRTGARREHPPDDAERREQA